MKSSIPIEEQIATNLDLRGYKKLTPIQNAIMNNDTIGRDALVSAQTGSGKTVAFGLSIVSNIQNEHQNNKVSKLPSVLIIAPTRELALQVQSELEWLYSKTNVFVWVAWI
jgi:ATP-dependent RNA helicase DeaD